jgi:hypothetical protein
VTKEEFAPQIGTSVAAGEIAYGDDTPTPPEGDAIAAAANPR